jgi:hypothetical protein
MTGCAKENELYACILETEGILRQAAPGNRRQHQDKWKSTNSMKI